MDPVPLSAAVTGVAVAVLFAYRALRAGKTITSMEHYYAGRELITPERYGETYLATNVTFTAVLLLLTEVGYQFGWWAFAAPLAWIIGMYGVRWVFLRRLVPSFAKGQLPRTLHEYCGQRFASTGIRRCLAGITILAFIGTVATEGIGLVYALAAFNLVHPLYMPLLLLGILVLMVVYAQRSGFPGVLATERPQLIFVAISFMALAGMAVTGAGLITSNQAISTPPVGISNGTIASLGFFILFIPFHLCVSDMWQRCYAAQWHPTLLKGMASRKMVVGFLLAFCLPISIGLMCREAGFAPAGQNYLLLEFVRLNLAALPPVPSALLAACLMSGFIAAGLSTADTLLVNAGFIYQYDWRLQPKPNEETDLRGLRESVLVLGLAAMLLVGPEFMIPGFNLVDLAYAVFSNQVAFAPVLLFAIFATKIARRGPIKVLVWSLLASLGACLSTVAAGVFTQDETLVSAAPVLGMAVSSVGIVVYLLAYSTSTPSSGVER